jgi:hypothetical protein
MLAFMSRVLRPFAPLIFLLVAACTGAAAESPLDNAARDYVRMALEIGTHEKDYVDAYYGPPEWRTEAEAHPRTLGELKEEAARMRAGLGMIDTGALQPQERARHAWLAAHVASAQTRLQMIEGARFPFREEAQRLFGLTPDLRPLESYDPVLARIEALVPGDGPLSERIEAFRNRYTVPKDRLNAVMDAAIAECRARTSPHLALSDNERFTMEFVNGQPWSAYNWYKGDNQSLIQINTDLPIAIDRAIGLGCHEGYPGHHVQGMNNERLYRDRGFIEFSIAPLYAPSSPLNEGGADFGVDLAFPRAERLAFETATLYPLAGLDPATAPALQALRDATRDLGGARLTISAMYLDGEIDRERAIELTQRYQLMSRARAEQSLRFTERYRSYVINYSSGEDLIRHYVERSADGTEAQWAAYQRIMTELMLPSDLAK